MKHIFLVIVLFLGIGSVGRAETTVSFEPNTVSLGESAQLIFSSDQPIDQIPDLSALQANFAVAGQQQRMQVVSINGRQQTQYELILNVFPRKSGEISTGELTFNGARLKPAKMTVLDQGAKASLPISFQARVSTNKVYPDETFLYTVRLTDGAGLSTGQMGTPSVQNARIVPLNMDKTWQDTDQDGKPVRIFERSFAITPEKEGYLTISPMELYGAIISSPVNRSIDLFDQGMLFNGFTSNQKDVRLETNPVQVKVLKKPANWKGWWLPSTQVKLSVEDTIPETVKVGDSLTRVIHLTAMGIEAERLPVIVQPGNDKLKIYPSPEQRNTVQSPVGDIQSMEELSLIMIPQASGELTIPAVRIPWFNTKKHKIEVAVLPEKKIIVQPGTQKTEPVTQSVPEEEDIVPERNKKRNKPISQEKPAEETSSKLGLPWVLGLTGLGVIAGFGLGFAIFRRKKHHRKSYLLLTKAEMKPKKKKKPLPDLYPF